MTLNVVCDEIRSLFNDKINYQMQKNKRFFRQNFENLLNIYKTFSEKIIKERIDNLI